MLLFVKMLCTAYWQRSGEDIVMFKENVGYQGWIHKMFVRIASREDPDQTASSEAV